MKKTLKEAYNEICINLKEDYGTKINSDFDFKKIIPDICSLLASNGFKSNERFAKYNYITNDNLFNFIKYREAHKNNYKAAYDCDKIFAKMYGYENADTMNSFATIYGYSKTKKLVTNFLEVIKEPYLSEYESDKKELDKLFNEFAKVTHSRGNFLVIPSLGNFQKRGIIINDFFDLTLICIKKYYSQKKSTNENPLHHILSDSNIKKWLDNYGNGIAGFKNFIDLNSLTMYVNKDYKIYDLMKKDEILEEKSIPLNRNINVKVFLENVIDKIKQRGKRLCI